MANIGFGFWCLSEWILKMFPDNPGAYWIILFVSFGLIFAGIWEETIERKLLRCCAVGVVGGIFIFCLGVQLRYANGLQPIEKKVAKKLASKGAPQQEASTDNFPQQLSINKKFAIFIFGLSLWMLWRFFSEANQRRISIEIERELKEHGSLGHFFRGRVHNDSSIYIEKAFIKVLKFKITQNGKVRGEPIPKLTLQWETGTVDRIDISPGERDCAFDITRSVNTTTYLMGFLNGTKQNDISLGDGYCEMTIGLFGRGLVRPIRKHIGFEITREPGNRQIVLREA